MKEIKNMSCVDIANKVEILLATYNSEEYIDDLLSSLLNQDYRDVEISVADDCSTDNTVSILKRYADGDDRVKIKSTNMRFGSAKSNFLWLMSQASADYIMLCDHDDFWHRDKVSLSLKALQKMEESFGSSEPALVFTDSVIVDENLELIASSHTAYSKMPHTEKQCSLKCVVVHNPVVGCTAIYNSALRNLMQNVSISPDSIVMHDWMLAIMASAAGHISYLPIATIDYRQSCNNCVGARRSSDISYDVYRKAKDSFWNSVEQAAYLSKACANIFPKKSRQLLEEFGSLEACSRIERVCKCARFGFWKHSAARVLGQLVVMLIGPDPEQ